MNEKIKIIFNDFEKALNNLKKATEIAKDDLDIDGTIKRFELTYELSWKLIKSFLEYNGIFCKSPRECFKYAFQNGIIDNELIWMKMIDDRNLLVHTYNFDFSREIFENIKNKYLKSFYYVKKFIQNKF